MSIIIIISGSTMIMTINKTSSTNNHQIKATNTVAFSGMGKNSHLESLEALSEGNNRKKEGESKTYISAWIL